MGVNTSNYFSLSVFNYMKTLKYNNLNEVPYISNNIPIKFLKISFTCNKNIQIHSGNPYNDLYLYFKMAALFRLLTH